MAILSPAGPHEADTMVRIAGAFAWRVVVLGMAGVLASYGSLPEQWEEGRKHQAPGVKLLRPLAQTTARTLTKDFGRRSCRYWPSVIRRRYPRRYI